MNIEDWAQKLIQAAVTEHGGPLDRYGTPAWAQMPAKQRWASILIAAECWRTTSAPDFIAARLRVEIEQARLLAKQAEDAAYRERAAAHAGQWRWLRGRGAPSHWYDDVDDPDDTPRGPFTEDELLRMREAS